MKYELPDDVKRYKFFCSDALAGVTHNGYKRHCYSDFRLCWKQHLIKGLALDRSVGNKR